MTQTVVGLMDSPAEVERVVEDLLQNGFDPKEVGIIAQDVRSESERVLARLRPSGPR